MKPWSRYQWIQVIVNVEIQFHLFAPTLLAWKPFLTHRSNNLSGSVSLEIFICHRNVRVLGPRNLNAAQRVINPENPTPGERSAGHLFLPLKCLRDECGIASVVRYLK